MTETDKYLIRCAIESDASAIISVHRKAVHETASSFYSESILDGWSPIDDTRVENMRDKLRDNPENTIILVIESNGVVAGFGEIVPEFEELRAVYVSPDFGRLGFGGLLLQELESRARQTGLSRLWLDSSLNAQEFYKANGYQIDGPGEHKLNSGQIMPCIKMSKLLT